MTWLDDAKRLDVGGVAAELGLQVKGRYSTCPTGCVRRGGDDRRMPVTLYPSGRWHCYACGASGDVIDLISHAVDRGRYSGQAAVREWLTDGGKIRIDIKEHVIEELHYAPTHEVHELWRWATVGSPKVSQWLERRLGADAACSVRPLVRQMPSRGTLPGWACMKGVDWREAGYLALFPMWDYAGIMRGLRARQVLGRSGPKSAGAAGCRGGGLVLACPLALTMLRRGTMPQHGLVICEGEPAFLGWASRRRDAVIGIGAGWWTVELAARVPVGTRVLVATDHDTPGERYADHITLSLRGRAQVTRAG